MFGSRWLRGWRDAGMLHRVALWRCGCRRGRGAAACDVVHAIPELCILLRELRIVSFERIQARHHVVERCCLHRLLRERQADCRECGSGEKSLLHLIPPLSDLLSGVLRVTKWRNVNVYHTPDT